MATNIITLLFFQKFVYQYNVIKLAETYSLLIARMEDPAWEDQEKALNERELHITQLNALFQGVRLFRERIGINNEIF
jgi:hypothetical protein